MGRSYFLEWGLVVAFKLKHRFFSHVASEPSWLRPLEVEKHKRLCP